MPFGPAGLINASVEEMAKHLTMHMQGEATTWTEVIAAKDAREMQSPQMSCRAPGPPTGEWNEPGDEELRMGPSSTTIADTASCTTAGTSTAFGRAQLPAKRFHRRRR
ncbi:MAG: hypothetical protein IPJ56_18205 [Gemmatimonadetes bacterium]|nr:hypothetical protein [Gemmatimonadota bacterium]